VVVSIPELDPFFSAKLRIARANEHIDTLDAEIAEFWAKKPYTHAAEDDVDGTHQTHKLCFTERFPSEWRILVTESVEHLRASLDHATWAVGFLCSGNVAIDKVAFPFGRTAADVDNSIKGRSKNLPTEIQAILRRLQPHEGGNDALCVLNNLCNLSKHTLIAIVAAVAFDPQFVIFRQKSAFKFLLPLTWDSVKNEIPYARVPKPYDLEHQANFKAFIALEYRGDRSEDSAVSVLRTILKETERAVLEIENETRRIGLIK
jgi:hypothetical protein